MQSVNQIFAKCGND